MMQRQQLLSIPINLGSYASFIENLIMLARNRQSYYACVANVHMLIEAYHSLSFADVVNNAELITPDGQPLAWGLKFLYGIKQERVAGMDLLPDLLAEAEIHNIPVAFYGGTEALLVKTKERLKKKTSRFNYSQNA